MKRKFNCAVIGATGYVGQRFITLLEDHPWFQVTHVLASKRSAGKCYQEAVKGRWKLEEAIPSYVKELKVYAIDKIEEVCEQIDFVFCAVDMDLEQLISLENKIAKLETPVISNNSANRWTADVPMIMPEINPEHSSLIEVQRKRMKIKRGFIAVKPNCSIQSYVPALTPLLDLGLEQVQVATYQAISGAGRRLSDWPEINANIIPYISGEEEKSELEPLKIWGTVDQNTIKLAKAPIISAQCYRVPVQEGHMAAVWMKFQKPCDANDILIKWRRYMPQPQLRDLPFAPKPFLRYIEEDNRPQPLLDAPARNGMGITIGRLREDPIFDYKFTCLSHNTIRGAAGGGILMAELLVDQGYIVKK